jgi:hypothetical protein
VLCDRRRVSRPFPHAELALDGSATSSSPPASGGVDAVHAILGAVILLDRRDAGGIAPAQSAVPAQRARPLPQLGPARNGGVFIESHPRNSAGKDTYSWPLRPLRRPDRAAARSRPRKIRTAGRTKATPAAGKRAASSKRSTATPFTGGGDPLDRAVRRHPGRGERPTGANGLRRSGPAGRRYRDLHPPGAPGPMSRQNPHERFSTGDRGH